MRAQLIGLGLLVSFFVIELPSAEAGEVSGYVAAEGRIFFGDPQFHEQRRDDFSISFEPEFYHEWDNGNSFTFTPFGRCDSADARRSHFDIRELNYLWLTEEWELRLGVSKVFWGAAEFVHLVDIINQVDLVENIDEEDRLGQPMAHFSTVQDWGTVDMFLLPWFRERTFPGRKGRLRTEPAVDTDHARYESGAEEQHLDLALRYSNTIGDLDFGIYNFHGTGREPTLLPELDKKGRMVLIPYYEQINQTGVDLQMAVEEWLIKFEGLYRTGQGEDFFAGIGGFEYTFMRLGDTAVDLGIVGEYAYDSRGDEATNPYDNDAMLGFRLTPNDAASTEFLAWIIQDVKNSARAVSVEASRRFGSNWKLSLEARAFFDTPRDDILSNLRDDDYLQIVLAYYF